MQTGSAFILIGSFLGAVPSIATTPFTSPAVEVSTFWPAGVPAGSADELGVSLLPPHAASDPISASPTRLTQTFRRRIDNLSSVLSTSPARYHTLLTGLY